MKLSIIVPAYNAEDVIERCVNSLFDQSFEDYEIILVNDGSTDRTLAKLQNLLQAAEVANKRFLLISQDNQGVSVARNVGIEYAQGEYLMFVDADDYVEPDSLIKVFNYINESGVSPDLALLNIKKTSINGLTEDITANNYSLRSDVDAFYKELYTNSLVFGVPWGKIFRRKIVMDNSLRFNAEYVINEDLLFNLQFAKYCKAAMTIPVSTYHYIHAIGGSTLKFMGEKTEQNNEGVRNALREYFIDYCHLTDMEDPINRRMAFEYLFKIYAVYRRRDVDNQLYWAKRIWAMAQRNDPKFSYQFHAGIPHITGILGRHSFRLMDLFLRSVFKIEKLKLKYLHKA